MQADIKQEKNHTEFSELLDREEITAEARREGADSDTGQHIPHHGWQLQAASKTPAQTFQLLYKNSVSSLSQLDLSLFTSPTQRAGLNLSRVSQERGVGKRLLPTWRDREQEPSLLSLIRRMQLR